jgi:hypothetical protein
VDRLPLLALALVGVLLVVNPVWLVPAADEPRYTYRAYDVATTDFEDGNWTDVRRDPEVLDCGVTEPPAACEPYIRATAARRSPLVSLATSTSTTPRRNPTPQLFESATTGSRGRR